MNNMKTLIIGEHLADFDSNKIQVLGQWLTVSPELMRILELLVLSNGKTVGKNDLISNECSGDNFARGNMIFRLAKLRKILRDSARTPKYIKSIPGEGYKLIAPVKLLNGSKYDPHLASFH